MAAELRDAKEAMEYMEESIGEKDADIESKNTQIHEKRTYASTCLNATARSMRCRLSAWSANSVSRSSLPCKDKLLLVQLMGFPYSAL